MSTVPSSAIIHIQDAFRDTGLNLVMDSEQLENTPIRWLKFIDEFMQPFDIEECLSKTFTPKYPEIGTMVVQANIPYRAICAHHLVPVLGKAHIGYIAHTKVVGLSKLARLIDGISHMRPSLQENVGEQVVNALYGYLLPMGAGCVIAAEHGCIACRGIAEPGVATVTSSFRGAFLEEDRGHAARAEFFELIKMHPAFL